MRKASTARTRRWSSEAAGSRSFAKMLVTCFSTARSVTTMRAAIPWFEQIERFYLALLGRLASRQVFDPVRESMPTRAPLLERVLWLGAQTTAADGSQRK